MKTMHVLDKNDKILFTGAHNECSQFVKMRRYRRGEVRIEELSSVEPYETTAPIEPEAKGFFKRIFKK